MAMTIRIAAADTMTKSILTNRPIVGIMAFVHMTGTITAGFPSDLTAAAIWVAVIPGEFTPFLVYGVIKRLGISTTYFGSKKSCRLMIFLSLLMVPLRLVVEPFTFSFRRLLIKD